MKTLPCPICKKPVEEPAPDAPRGHFPFCSGRCQSIDLGRWLDGAYRIPAEVTPDDEDFPPPTVRRNDSR